MPTRPQALLSIIAVTLLTTCRGSDGTGPAAPIPTDIALVSGDHQTGTVGQVLPQPLVIEVTSSTGAAVEGVTVAWQLNAVGGALSAASIATDALGRAGVSVTLGTAAGSNNVSVTASVAGLNGSPVTFTASTAAGPVSQLSAVSGNLQTGAVGQAVPESLVVAVKDQFDNPVIGALVTWVVTAGGGSVSLASVTTDAQGRAAVAWTLGSQPGSQRVTAAVAGVAGPPLEFVAAALAGAAAQIVLVSGNDQSGIVGTALTDPYVVRVTDAFGNPVAGVAVTWGVTAGGGSIAPLAALTNSSGLDSAIRTLGTVAGINADTATATGAGLTGSPIAFTATAHAGPVTHLSPVSGDNQTGTVGLTIPESLVVLARDLYDNPVPGALVGWSVTAGGGTLSAGSAPTDSQGRSSVSWTLGPTAGPQGAAATFGGAVGSPVPFAVTGLAGPPSAVTFLQPPGNTAAGAVMTPAVTVAIVDAFGNLVTTATDPVEVVIASNPAGGVLSGTTLVSAVNGVATFADLSIDQVGAGYSLQAFSGSLTAVTSPAFTVTTSGTVLVFTAHPVTTQAGAAIAPAVQVTAQDALGNTVVGFTGDVTVAIGNNPGSGTLSGTLSQPAVAGVAAFSNLSIDQAGTGYTLSATSGALTSTPSAPFNITASVLGSVVVSAGNGQTGLVGYPLNVAPAVLVRDAANAPVASAQVTFAVAGGGGGVTGADATTDVNGIATVGSWTVQLGTNTLTATVAGSGITGNPVTFTATGAQAAYDIEVRFLTPTSPSRLAAFTNAAALWATLIYGDVPNIQVNLPPGACASNTPGLHETIDDIVIFAVVDSIDGPGNILGQAGPCFIRNAGKLPLLGVMMFDSADVAQLELDGQFELVILHEMGHVLGYGTIWPDLGLLVGEGGADPHFVGAQAIAAFNRVGGQSYVAGAKVPVENCCGPGTQDAHWREFVFVNELMTGFLDAGANPLSVISTASMGDLGYRVNYAGSDSYTVTNPVAAISARPRPPLLLKHDVLRIPLVELDASGSVVQIHPPR